MTAADTVVPIAAGHGDPIAPVILGVTSILFFAIVGLFVARRLGQPTVLGELLMGILLGNLAYYLDFDLITLLREGARVFEITSYVLAGVPVDEAATAIFGDNSSADVVRIISGPHGAEILQVAHIVDVFSRFGVIFMLFMVGLETNVQNIWETGADSVRVAAIGVVVPFATGMLVAQLLMPGLPVGTGMFIAATLVATSIGITSNVLRELGRQQSREGHIILGAAVGDDVLGLITLAIVSGVVVSGSVQFLEIVSVALLSILLLVATFYIGPRFVRFAARIMARLHVVEAKMFTSYLFVMVLAWLANLAGLATIIGAFAAGLVLNDTHFDSHTDEAQKTATVRELIMPLEVILAPIFFILIGIQVKIESFASWNVIIVASGLLVAAIFGKLVAGFGAGTPVDKLIVGIGMLPRGEVGLVFAAIGRGLGVFDDALFSAIVLMIIVTTLITPPLLKLAIERQKTPSPPSP